MPYFFIPPEAERHPRIVGYSPVIARLNAEIDRVAEHDHAVIIHGESGTGKDVVAQAVHIAGSRRNGPFVAVNCAGFSATLVDAELFGHTKDAFTGANRDKAGAIENAHEGSLFLDEIGDMPLLIQAKLLRTLETGKLRRLGGHDEITVDVRIIAATHKNLQDEVAEGEFRHDLLHRLNVDGIYIRPLRERKEDIPLLIRYFLNLLDEDPPQFSPELMTYLQAQDWPGNVRQLRNKIWQLSTLKLDRPLTSTDIPPNVFELGKQAALRLEQADPNRADEALPAKDAPIRPLREVMAECEMRCIQQALERTGGNQAAAARLLGLKKTTLHMKLKKQEGSSESSKV